MLSEPIDAAGSDQQTAGGISASPFVIGDASEDCNLFYDLIKAHEDKIECYMLNTGGVGEIVEHDLDGARRVRQKVTRVKIPEMASIIRGIARGTISWSEDPNWMVETPTSVDGLDIAKFALSQHYDQHKIDSLIAATRLERADYAAQLERMLNRRDNARFGTTATWLASGDVLTGHCSLILQGEGTRSANPRWAKEPDALHILYTCVGLVIPDCREAGPHTLEGTYMHRFDISPFALPNCEAGEYIFEEPHDICRVEVTFKGPAPRDISAFVSEEHLARAAVREHAGDGESILLWLVPDRRLR